MKIDRENERFSLGVKQLEPDPWQEAMNKYPLGTTVEGKITNVTDFGVFVQLEEGVEGLVHVSEISKEKINTPVGMYNVGDMMKVMIINVSAKDRKIGLSIKALEDDGGGQGSYQEFQKKQPSGPSTIGDLIKSELENKEQQEQSAADTAEKTAELDAVADTAEETAEEDAAPDTAEETAKEDAAPETTEEEPQKD